MIYFYGGAFNPMTKAHLEIIKSILDNMKDEDSFILAITDHDYKTYSYDYDTRLNIVFKNLENIGFDYTLGGRYKVIKQTERTWKFLQEKLKLTNNVTIVVGEDEIAKNKFKLKDMKTGEEKEINMDDIDKIKL